MMLNPIGGHRRRVERGEAVVARNALKDGCFSKNSFPERYCQVTFGATKEVRGNDVGGAVAKDDGSKKED